MVGAGMFDGLAKIMFAGFIAMIIAAGLVGYLIIDKFFINHKKFESKTVITPTIKLHTDGVKIDTIYVYDFNKK